MILWYNETDLFSVKLKWNFWILKILQNLLQKTISFIYLRWLFFWKGDKTNTV